MSLNSILKSREELMEHLKNVDNPKCFTVNYLPDTGGYELWIGNQPYYHYEKLIELEEKDNKNLIKRIRQLNKDKEDMYQLAARADWGDEDWKSFERVFSK